MTTVSILEAKKNLSKYFASVENGAEAYIVIARAEKPVARIVPYEQETGSRIRGISPI